MKELGYACGLLNFLNTLGDVATPLANINLVGTLNIQQSLKCLET